MRVETGSFTKRLKLKKRPVSRITGCRFAARKAYWSWMSSVGFALGKGIGAGLLSGMGLMPGVALILGGIVGFLR